MLAFAVKEQRAVLTINRKHFIRLHQQDARHAGIVVCTFDPDFVRQARRIHETLSEFDLLEHRLVRVNRPA